MLKGGKEEHIFKKKDTKIHEDKHFKLKSSLKNKKNKISLTSIFKLINKMQQQISTTLLTDPVFTCLSVDN